MKAVGYWEALPIDNPESLIDLDIAEPQPGARDLLVRVKAVSVNPVDTKVRRSAGSDGKTAKILGWDAVGIVEAVGSDVSQFKVGDRVYYAGAIGRPGSNSELHVVDERIAARAPKTLTDAQAAALPLTAITAWELLFDRLQLQRKAQSVEGQSGALLIVGGAGGVGSMAIQLARQLTDLQVIATASRSDSKQWCLQLGAHHVIDHTQAFAPQLAKIGIPNVSYVASLVHTERHYEEIIEVLEPQGRLGLIDDLTAPLDVMKLKSKALSLHWEMMFARSLFETPDMIAQQRLLTELAELVDAGRIRTTLSEVFGTINAANLRRAHQAVEAGNTRGKLVLEGFA